MKQKIVIQMSLSCDKSRRIAMATAAKTTGVISVGITGDGRDMLEVVGTDVDTVCLVGCLRKKLRHANIVKVEQVKDKTEEEKKKEEKKKKEEEEAWKLLHCYPGYHPQHPSHMAVCDEPANCVIL